MRHEKTAPFLYVHQRYRAATVEAVLNEQVAAHLTMADLTGTDLADRDGSYFLDQESFETLTLGTDVVGNALDLLVEGTLLQTQKYNGNPGVDVEPKPLA